MFRQLRLSPLFSTVLAGCAAQTAPTSTLVTTSLPELTIVSTVQMEPTAERFAEPTLPLPTASLGATSSAESLDSFIEQLVALIEAKDIEGLAAISAEPNIGSTLDFYPTELTLTFDQPISPTQYRAARGGCVCGD